MLLFYLLILDMSEGCRLEGNRDTVITAYTGESVLLPCSCTDIHTKPHTHTWSKFSSEWVKISPDSDQYKDRLQLVNDHHPGNLSLIISHLTVQDKGVYRCGTEKEERFFTLTVEGCTIHNEVVDVAGYEGQSVLLPCSCTHLQAKPQTFTWTFYIGTDHKVIFPKDQINHYTHRVQIYKDHHPGNLSLLISHLTLQDGGYYRCQTVNNNYKDIRLTVKGDTKTPPPSTTMIQTAPNPQSNSSEEDTNTTIIVIIIIAGVVVLLLLIVGGVLYWKHRGQRREQISEGETGQGKQKKKKKNLSEPLNSTITPEPTYEAVNDQNDSAVLYASVNRPPKVTKAQEKDDVTYSTVALNNTQTKAHPLVASGDSTVYASIKLTNNP